MNYYVYDINTMKSSCQSFSALCFLGALCQMCMKGGHENGLYGTATARNQ